MLLTASLIFVSLGCSGLTFYYLNLYTTWIWFWVPIVETLVLFWLAFLLVCLVCAAIVPIGIDYGRLYPYSRFYARLLATMMRLGTCFLKGRVYVSGKGKLPEDTNFMMVSNHLSGFDHMCLVPAFYKTDMVCIYKKSVEKIILAGGMVKKAGYLGIIQGDLENGKRVIGQAGEILKEGKVSVCVAPEGTRNKTFPEPLILPFHPGTFQMAVEAKKPIVCCCIQNAGAILPRVAVPWGTRVYVDVVGVVYPEQYEGKTLKEIADHCQAMIAKRMEEKIARCYHLKRQASE